MGLWNVDDYVRLRTGGDDPSLELFAERFVRPGIRVLEVGCGPACARGGTRPSRCSTSRSWPEGLNRAEQVLEDPVEYDLTLLFAIAKPRP